MNLIRDPLRAAHANIKRLNLAKSLAEYNLLKNQSNKCYYVAVQRPKMFSEGIVPVVDQPINAVLTHDLLGFTNHRFVEPGLLFGMEIDHQGTNVKPFLIRRQVNAKEKLWDGPSIPDEDFAALSGITNIQSYDPHHGSLLSAFKSATGECFKGSHCFADEESCKLLGSKLQDIKLQSAERAISSASLKKTDMDIEDFKSSVGVAVAALKDIMQNCRKFKNEFEIECRFAAQCFSLGASRLAYPPVVASGKNASSIHYLRNCDQLKSHDMVLVDAGCVVNGKNSDITRTWPLSGKFSPPQRKLYDIVYETMQLCFESASRFASRHVTLDDLHLQTIKQIGRQMSQRGILVNPGQSERRYYEIGIKYCPHHVSHHIGTLLHDCSHLEFSRAHSVLQNSMCFTIEPGLYIDEHDTEVHPEFRGMGIRLENCVMLKDNKLVNLSGELPTQADEVEKLICGAGR